MMVLTMRTTAAASGVVQPRCPADQPLTAGGEVFGSGSGGRNPGLALAGERPVEHASIKRGREKPRSTFVTGCGGPAPCTP
ncbi:hypothetical protein RHA1_ro03124 [Rhodococcus jostii RHA1]|uniref:Uncharacterized protein n=1 Tax=Rhodococcus jostii (strain RHA1) TaxID=101510 RepID=Q0SC09_RHOJR|nr:hypothetical protein RHA1_ro03124 [Rhodococcus jostii RHA1]